MKLKFIALILLCTASLSHSSFAQDTTLVYGNSYSYLPLIEIDPDTGTIGLAWLSSGKRIESGRFSDFYNSKLWFAMVTKNDNGAIKLQKPKLVSQAVNWASACFNTSEKKFVFTWETFSTPNHIKAKSYDLKGRPNSAIIPITAGGHDNEKPLITYASDDNSYLLFWSISNEKFNQLTPGLSAAVLNSNLSVNSIIKNINPVIRSDFNQWPIEPLATERNPTTNRIFMLARVDTIRDFKNNKMNGNYFLYILDSSGNLFTKKKISFFTKDQSLLNWYAGVSNADSAKKPNHLIAWSENNSVYFRTLNRKGGVGSPVKVNVKKPIANPSVAFSSALNKYIITFSSIKGIGYIFVDPRNTKSHTKIKYIKGSSQALSCKVKSNESSKNFVLIWINKKNGFTDNVWFSEIN